MLHYMLKISENPQFIGVTKYYIMYEKYLTSNDVSSPNTASCLSTIGEKDCRFMGITESFCGVDVVGPLNMLVSMVY